jgi:hypothetical protein
LSSGIFCGWKISVSTEVGVENTVLEARRILKINVELTVLSLIGDGSTGSAGCNHGVEDQGESKAYQHCGYRVYFASHTSACRLR